MKKFNFYYLFLFLSVGVLLTGCKEDEPEEPTNAITITIEEPINEEKIAMADCAEVHVHIDIDATVENHEIEIILHPEGDVNTKIIDHDKHDHDKEIKFEQEVDLCGYESGDCFHLEVFACIDHDCAEKASGEVEFCLE